MTRKYKITALLLALCMCVSVMFPEQVQAQDTEQNQEDIQEQTEMRGIEDTQETSDDYSESEMEIEDEQMEEEFTAIEEEDPGQGRLSGDVPKEFYGDEMKTRAVSSGVTHDSRFDAYEKKLGINVSKWNKNIDWNKVKADGVEFAFVRVGYRGYGSGGLGSDEYADSNMKNAAAAGVKVGAYIFSQAITEKEAVEEADYILQKVKGYNITMPLVFDFEYYSGGRLEKANLSRRKQTDICLAFCERVKAAGYTPLVYANKSMLSSDLYAEEISSKYPIWLAHYTNKTNYTGAYDYWQYSSTGTVNGISGNVDMNYWYVKPGSELSENISKPGTPSISGKASSFDTVSLSWSSVPDATGYILYRYSSSSKAYERIKTITSNTITSYVNSGRNASTTYKYKVKAYKKSGGTTVYGNASNIAGVKTSGSATGKTTGTSVSVRTGPSTSKSRITTLGINEGVTLTGSSGSWYKVSIKVKGKKKTGYISKDYVTIIKKPSLKASGESKSKVSLKWNKISDANGYQIQRYDSSKKKYVTIKTIKSGATTSYTNSGLKKNTTYKYRIRSYKKVRGRNIYSYYCSAKSARTKK